MIKSLRTLFLAAALMVVSSGFSQVKFGLKGGVNVTKMSLSPDVFKVTNNEGFFLGPTVMVKVPLAGLGVDASLLYDQRSAKVNYAVEGASMVPLETRVVQKHVAVPIHLRYSFGLGGSASAFLFAGPQFGFNVAQELKDIDWKWKSSTLSVNVGVGLMALQHLQLTVNYNVQCGTTGEVDADAAAEQVFSGKEHAWQIGLAYYF